MGRVKFPGAPPESWVSEEGWLIYDDEAWTEHEWAVEPHPPRGGGSKYRIRYETDQERREAKRASSRESIRRKRAA